MRKHETSTSLESEASSAPFVPTNPLNKNILKKFTDEESADVIFEVGSVSGGAQRANTRRRAKISPTMFHAHRLILQDGAPMLAELCNPVGGGIYPQFKSLMSSLIFFVICSSMFTGGNCRMMT